MSETIKTIEAAKTILQNANDVKDLTPQQEYEIIQVWKETQSKPLSRLIINHYSDFVTKSSLKALQKIQKSPSCQSCDLESIKNMAWFMFFELINRYTPEHGARVHTFVNNHYKYDLRRNVQAEYFSLNIKNKAMVKHISILGALESESSLHENPMSQDEQIAYLNKNSGQKINKKKFKQIVSTKAHGFAHQSLEDIEQIHPCEDTGERQSFIVEIDKKRAIEKTKILIQKWRDNKTISERDADGFLKIHFQNVSMAEWATQNNITRQRAEQVLHSTRDRVVEYFHKNKR